MPNVEYVVEIHDSNTGKGTWVAVFKNRKQAEALVAFVRMNAEAWETLRIVETDAEC